MDAPISSPTLSHRAPPSSTAPSSCASSMQQQQQQPQQQQIFAPPPPVAPKTPSTDAFIRDLNLVAEAAKRAQMAVLMRDLEGVAISGTIQHDANTA
ncbi:hypothetical protein AAE478_006745 [Parahypoxylon ruwenzoriense]